MQQFIDHGYDVTVLGIRRAPYKGDYAPASPHIASGCTARTEGVDSVCAHLHAMPTETFVAAEDGALLCALLDRVAARRIVDRWMVAAGGVSQGSSRPRRTRYNTKRRSSSSRHPPAPP